jgi:hypothetical protein
VGNVCAEGRWFGTKVREVWLFYCLNSTSSFLFAIFNCYLIFLPIVPVVFSSDHKAFAGNVGDVRFASSVSGKQRCVLTVQIVLCCRDGAGTTAEQPMNQTSRQSVYKQFETFSLVTTFLPSREV